MYLTCCYYHQPHMPWFYRFNNSKQIEKNGIVNPPWHPSPTLNSMRTWVNTSRHLKRSLTISLWPYDYSLRFHEPQVTLLWVWGQDSPKLCPWEMWDQIFMAVKTWSAAILLTLCVWNSCSAGQFLIWWFIQGFKTGNSRVRAGYPGKIWPQAVR